MSYNNKFNATFAMLMCSCLLVACKAEESTTNESPPLKPVKVLEASMGSAAAQRVLAASVVSANSQNLSFRVAGAITSLPVVVGARLNTGDVIATLDQQPFLLNEKEGRASLAQASSGYRNARSQYQRTRDLYATEAASLSDLENAKANASSARANQLLAQERLNGVLLNLEYSRLISPSDQCQVVSVPVATNQNISAGQTIVTTDCGNDLRARMVVPASLINTIRLGMEVNVAMNAGATTLKGNVVEIASSTSNGTGYAVEVELNSPPPSVKIGMAAQVTLSLASSDQRMLVPLIAVLSDDASKFVFVATPKDDHYQIKRQAVVTGELDNNGIEILEGLEQGQHVVVAGMSRIAEGMKVTLYAGEQP